MADKRTLAAVFAPSEADVAYRRIQLAQPFDALQAYAPSDELVDLGGGCSTYCTTWARAGRRQSSTG
jgi:hypothetical protein